MALSPLAGKPAPAQLLIDVARLERDYYQRTPDLADVNQLVSFGTSGHRGTPFNGTFTEPHILATTQAICEYRKGKGINGPLFIGKDSHAISASAQRTALEVLAANGVETFIQRDDGFTPTPSISHAILTYNRGRTERRSPTASSLRHRTIRRRMAGSNTIHPMAARRTRTSPVGCRTGRMNSCEVAIKDVRRLTYESALKASNTHPHDFITPYVETLGEVIDMDAIRSAGVRIGIDPLGGASLPYWQPVKERYGLDLTVVNYEGGSAVRFHDRGSRRQNPHGLFESVRHGRAGATEGQIQRRIRH